MIYNRHDLELLLIFLYLYKDFNGSTIKVQMAMVRAPPSGGYPGARGGGGGGGRGGGDRGRGGRGGFGGGRGGRDGEQSNFQGRPGDWR